MHCPSCRNTKIATYDTRRIEDMVVRKRKCLACDERFYTLERYMSEEELEEVQELRRSNVGKVLHGVSDDTGHSRGSDEKDRQDKPLDMPELLGEAEFESLREGGD
jgi:transcriptional regulator NrdR family protein